MNRLSVILQESSSRHKHLCPRQVLGARMGLLAGELLSLEVPRKDKKLLTISETDGCTVDGLIASTGCHVGGRTLRILDFGKVAATFVNSRTEQAFRIVPKVDSRSQAIQYAPRANNKWEAMLLGYQLMPSERLFNVAMVQLSAPIEQIISRAGKKAICEVCGEEIINGREVVHEAMILCQACVGNSYYQVFDPIGQANPIPKK